MAEIFNFSTLGENTKKKRRKRIIKVFDLETLKGNEKICAKWEGDGNMYGRGDEQKAIKKKESRK